MVLKLFLSCFKNSFPPKKGLFSLVTKHIYMSILCFTMFLLHIYIVIINFSAVRCICGSLIHPKDKHTICVACRLRPADVGVKLKYHCQTHSDGSQSLGQKCGICKAVPIQMFQIWTDCKLYFILQLRVFRLGSAVYARGRKFNRGPRLEFSTVVFRPRGPRSIYPRLVFWVAII